MLSMETKLGFSGRITQIVYYPFEDEYSERPNKSFLARLSRVLANKNKFHISYFYSHLKLLSRTGSNAFTFKSFTPIFIQPLWTIISPKYNHINHFTSATNRSSSNYSTCISTRITNFKSMLRIQYNENKSSSYWFKYTHLENAFHP